MYCMVNDLHCSIIKNTLMSHVVMNKTLFVLSHKLRTNVIFILNSEVFSEDCSFQLCGEITSAFLTCF